MLRLLRWHNFALLRWKNCMGSRRRIGNCVHFRCRHLLLRPRPLVRPRPRLCWICRRVGFHHHWFHFRPWQTMCDTCKSMCESHFETMCDIRFKNVCDIRF